MNYSIEEIEALAAGTYPQRCLAGREFIGDEEFFVSTCLVDKGEQCGMSHVPFCVMWQEVNVFSDIKLAEDIMELHQQLTPSR